MHFLFLGQSIIMIHSIVHSFEGCTVVIRKRKGERRVSLFKLMPNKEFSLGH